MYYPAAFDEESQRRFKALPECQKDLRFRVRRSAVRLQRNQHWQDILLNRISTDLSAELGSLGYEVIQVELTEFLKAGGAAKCLVLRLSEMDVTHRTV